ncbi:HupE/UreJ family protein [Flagellimonas zhangzhouensis]|uniref:HupE / UreJ protein n=1 Tax=Flagellimonas zhangzhouensis TaxID=1073328 RepID=A0A1H2Y8T3_9FLAO|nr:HupE/UreJ family protein [Allomuricauda zhangzhouensis]SDQ98760.1 HupE / UreJ protein [Allomuricauda zhangzhouensis]SDX00969.1 HupE / UreJ protein [Allomuricauda zhangzhouensis]
MNKVLRALLFLILALPFNTLAHEVRPAYLQINEVSSNTYNVLWKVPRTADKVLDIQPLFNNSFTLNETIAPRILEAFVLYTYQLKGPISLSNTTLTINNLNKTGVDVLVDIRLLNGEHHSFLLQPSKNIIVVPEKPNKWMVAKTYIVLGIEHILLGFDHLLFVLALLLITKGFKKLLKTITAFTLAHSITLSFSVLGIASLPGPPVEAVIALSIVFLAMEILKIQKGVPSLTSQKPWLVAFSFGLLHGFGFAGALQEIGLPQQEIPLALATFNLGVELGQILFVILVFTLLKLPKSFMPKHVWMQKIIPYAIGSVASFWLIERIIGF